MKLSVQKSVQISKFELHLNLNWFLFADMAKKMNCQLCSSLAKAKRQTLPVYKILYSNRFGIGYSASLRLINTGGRNDFFFCPLITLFLPLLSRNNWPLLWVNLSVLGTMVQFFYQINWRTWVTFEPWVRLKNSNHGYVDFL